MIKKILFICSFVFCFQTISFCYSDEVLNDIEYRKYGTTFQAESLAERLCRLETDYFGMEQQGSIETRLEMLSRMSNNYRTSAIQTPAYNNYPIKKKSAIRNFFDNLGDVGTMTGFTPSLSSTTYHDGSYFSSSGNKYIDNLPRRALNRFLNNRTGYCPHHNRYVNHSPYHNMGWGSSNYNHGWHNHNPHHNYHHNQAYIPPNYTNSPVIQRNIYVPPNVQSRTAVRIIRD